ncbi:MAG: asparaginase domain-containing protein [Candidatus Paceibacterota bacterium]|jgi:L-asparaginase|nr:asparaginase [Candidatus Paceibacterota bacterium]
MTRTNENKNSNLRIIVAGGTIDAIKYDFKEGKVLAFGVPAVEKILRTGRVRHIDIKPTEPIADDDADIFVLPQKDSLEMTNEDRERILHLCLADKRERILITHGTDTMAKTGALLAQKITGKTIVLTGAMRPNASENSDAPFNLGGALIAAETLPSGVYIVIQGEIFLVPHVQKIKKNGDGYFEKMK